MTERPPNTEPAEVPEARATSSDGGAITNTEARDDVNSDVRVIDRRWWARAEDSADTNGERSDKPSYVVELEQQVADKDALLKEHAAKYRAAADEFEEARARLRREVDKDVEREKRSVLAAFLDVVDNIERAIDAARSAAEDNPTAGRVVEGIELVKQQCLSTLQSFGVTPLEAGGQPFDPTLHDAVSTVPVDRSDQANVVIDVIKVGYVIGEDVLRPASVTVGKPAPESQ